MKNSHMSAPYSFFLCKVNFVLTFVNFSEKDNSKERSIVYLVCDGEHSEKSTLQFIPFIYFGYEIILVNLIYFFVCIWCVIVKFSNVGSTLNSWSEIE